MSTKVIKPFENSAKNFTLFNNALLDIIMPDLSPNAWKVLCLIIRQTRGWQKDQDSISFSQIRQGTGIASDSTVSKALKELTTKQYILAKKNAVWKATSYALNEDFSTTLSVVQKVSSTESVGQNGDSSTTEVVDTKEIKATTKEIKDSSDKSEYATEISFLTIKEIKATKQTVTEWQEWLNDEKSERQRSGVIDFIEKKLLEAPLLSDSNASKILFDTLEDEYKVKSRRLTRKFPDLATKKRFEQAAAYHNGSLESVIEQSIAAVGLGLKQIVSYMSSNKWRENDNQRVSGPARKGKRGVGGGKGGSRGKDRRFQPQNDGQSQETRDKLYEMVGHD